MCTDGWRGRLELSVLDYGDLAVTEIEAWHKSIRESIWFYARKADHMKAIFLLQ